LAVLAAGGVLAMAGVAAAQPAASGGDRPASQVEGREAAPREEPGSRRAPAEVARLFDAYALVQAQDDLGLDEAQYAQFVGRYRSLLETRRRHALARLRLVQELNRLTRGARAPSDEVLRGRLKALDDHDAKAAHSVATALAQVDDGLTLKQRARLRVLEAELERKKFELMGRARESARPGSRRTPPA
jgi:hypothetical protein